jgi:hypothetical protein
LHSSDTGEKWKYNGTVHQLLADFKKAFYSVESEALLNVFIFCIPIKIVRLIRICLKVHTGKYLPDAFLTQNGLKQEILYRRSFSTLL